MAENRSYGKLIAIGLAGAIGCAILILNMPNTIANYQAWRTDIKQASDDENYEAQKKVEDNARTMISSYKSDLLMYETYIESDKEEEQEWAKQAKIRANKTAIQYNEYILKNNYVWKDNIPDDIDSELEIIK